MSEPTTAPAKPARSPVERAIVWGVIGVGLIVILVEGTAHFAHGAAVTKLQAQVQANSEKDMGVTKKDIVKVVGNKIPEQQKLDPFATSFGAAHVEIYNYAGLLKQRKLFVYYGIAGRNKDQEPEVLEVRTDPAETAAEVQAKAPKVDPNAPVAGPPPGMAPMMGGGPGGPGGGPGGPGGRGGPGGAGGRPAIEGETAKTDDGEKKTEDKPAAEDKPAEDKPAEDKPADTEKPAEEAKPAAETPAEAEAKKE